MIDPFSIILVLTAISIILFILGFILAQSLGTILILIAIFILGFNLLYYYLDKTDTTTKLKTMPKGIVCSNCGAKLEPGTNFCSSCGFSNIK